MKRSVAIGAVTLLACLAISSGANAGEQQGGRTTEVAYQTPVAGVAIEPLGTRAYYYNCLNGTGCALIRVQHGERRVSLEIVDASGLPAYGEVYLTPGFYEVGQFCGKTHKPIGVSGAAEVLVHVESGVCPDGTPSIATHGVVRATFTR